MLQIPIYQPQVISNNQFSPLGFLSALVLSIRPEFAWLFVLLIGIFFTIASFVLSYHWKRFGLEPLVMAKATILYFSISSVLLVTMVISVVVYLNSI